jgi:predicted subunit of tRNA(5-methylaminomethyl-2-thiouridylate) methyltransferase
MHVRYSLAEKIGGMHMANQSITRRQPTEVVVQQHTPGQVVQRVHEKAQEIRGVVTTAAEVYDETRRDLEANVSRGGRSAGHQRYVEERTAYLQTVFDDGMRTLVTGAVRDILHEGPTEIVRTISVPEPRKPWYQALSSR